MGVRRCLSHSDVFVVPLLYTLKGEITAAIARALAHWCGRILHRTRSVLCVFASASFRASLPPSVERAVERAPGRKRIRRSETSCLVRALHNEESQIGKRVANMRSQRVGRAVGKTRIPSPA